jgi:hypothetical protein
LEQFLFDWEIQTKTYQNTFLYYFYHFEMNKKHKKWRKEITFCW